MGRAEVSALTANPVPAEAIRAQSGVVARLRRVLAGLSPSELAWKPAPGKWSIKEIVCHLADVELAYGFRYRLIAAENEPRLTPFNQDAWANHLGYLRQDLRQALEVLRVLRARHVAMFKALPADAWDRAGMHEERGRLTLRQIVESIAAHDENHLGQIRRIKALLRERRKAG